MNEQEDPPDILVIFHLRKCLQTFSLLDFVSKYVS